MMSNAENNNKKWGMLIYENVQPMDVIGPWEVFSFWKNSLHAPLDLFLISEKVGEVKAANGMTLQSHVDFQQAPLLDGLMVPGGYGRLQEMHHAETIAFIQKQAAHCQYIASVCTGMFLLYQAGLLHGHLATTYWRALPELAALPGMKIVQERVVKSGNIWMSGGVTSGIDLALALIAEMAGEEVAGQVQLLLEYFPDGRMYCNKNTAATLPAYGQTQTAELPEYIKRILL